MFKLGVFFPLVERVKEQLKLSLETKNGVVQTGELTVVLDGLVIEQENRTNCSSSPTSKLITSCVFKIWRKKKQQEVYKNLVSFFFVIQWKYSKMVMPYMKMETLRQGQPPGRMFYFSICDKVINISHIWSFKP